MNVSRCIFSLGAGLLLLAGCKKDNADQKTLLTDNKVISATDQMVHTTVKGYAQQQSTAGFSIALIDKAVPGSASIHFYNYGETAMGNGQVPTAATAYEIGSITKTFTAAAMYVHAIQQFGASYTDFMSGPAANYLPAGTARGLTKNGSSATVQQLLNHTSGLARLPENFERIAGYDLHKPYASYDSSQVYTYLSTHDAAYTPGSLPTAATLQEHYSNLGFGTAGLLLMRMQAKSFSNLLAAAGMGNWFIPVSGNALPNGLAQPHNTHGTPVAAWHPMGGFAGAGGLFSSAEKLSVMLRDYITAGESGSTLSAGLATAMGICTTPSIKINGVAYFGRGWEFFALDNGKVLTVKDGGTGGSTAFVAFDKATHKAIVLLTNNQSGNGQADVFLALCTAWFN